VSLEEAPRTPRVVVWELSSRGGCSAPAQLKKLEGEAASASLETTDRVVSPFPRARSVSAR